MQVLSRGFDLPPQSRGHPSGHQVRLDTHLCRGDREWPPLLPLLLLSRWSRIAWCSDDFFVVSRWVDLLWYSQFSASHLWSMELLFFDLASIHYPQISGQIVRLWLLRSGVPGDAKEEVTYRNSLLDGSGNHFQTPLWHWGSSKFLFGLGSSELTCLLWLIVQ